MLTINAELTDTFAGEANYAWVRRASVTLPEGASDRAIVRAAKKALGLSGVRCRIANFGEMIEMRPRGSNTVAFVTFAD